MSIETRYEWDYERFNPETGDIIDHDHRDKLREFVRLPDSDERLVLVRDVICEFDGVIDRGWAYVENGELPEFFSGCDDDDVRIPKKYRQEFERWHRRLTNEYPAHRMPREFVRFAEDETL